MKLQIMSDIHTEFHRDRGLSFVRSVLTTKEEADVLVLAGDVGDATTIREALEIFADLYCPRPVIYVQGNHEYYKGDFERTHDQIQIAVAMSSNLVWLNHEYDWMNSRAERFIGTPLWFRDEPMTAALAHMIGDYQNTLDHGKFIKEENKKALDFLNVHLQQDDILITHHLPSYQCVDPKYKDSELNIFFVCDISELIMNRKPKLAIHGHTHESIDTMIGETRVVCNPFGYAGVETNPNFKEKFIVEI